MQFINQKSDYILYIFAEKLKYLNSLMACFLHIFLFYLSVPLMLNFNTRHSSCCFLNRRKIWMMIDCLYNLGYISFFILNVTLILISGGNKSVTQVKAYSFCILIVNIFFLSRTYSQLHRVAY